MGQPSCKRSLKNTAAEIVPVYQLAETATDDLHRIVRHIALSNPAAAAKIAIRLVKIFEHLAFSPHAGRARPDLAENLRSFPAAPYIVFYHIDENGIAVDRILHGARNITPDFFDPDA